VPNSSVDYAYLMIDMRNLGNQIAVKHFDGLRPSAITHSPLGIVVEVTQPNRNKLRAHLSWEQFMAWSSNGAVPEREDFHVDLAY